MLARLLPVVLALLSALVVTALAPSAASAACANPVACENQLPGDPPADWQVTGAGDSSIQGFATQFSVNVGQTISFKIKTPSTSYHIDILRLGYYGGDGARLIASDIKPTATLPQTQPDCVTDDSTGLIDCGNWSVSASWIVPSNAVSGVYIAHLVRDDSSDRGGDSQIPFVVRNDASHSDMVVATSDATWEAYNDYGGNSLYTCTVDCPPGNPLAYKAAYAVSYNRPFDGSFATDGGASYLYYAEYQMIYFLEQNGYDVSYVSDSDLDRNPALLQNHNIFISSGHDEYWSGNEMAGVQAALGAGVNLAFFSGNEIFWKTRWAASEDGSNTPYRTLVTYKETHFNAPTDPKDPSTWTGAWADPRFSPPANGGVPANSLTGQMFVVNSGTADITVPSQYSKLRIWRNTAVAKLTAGQSLTLAPGVGTLGYEWDSDPDNGFRPPGEFNLSSTTVSGVQPFTDYGSTTANSGTETHHLSLYRTPSGALVFGAGTVQWAWGLENVNAWDSTTTDPSNRAPDPTMQQATVNLFADMGAEPTTLMNGLTAATQSTDTTPPQSSITSPAPGGSVSDGANVTISGSATDSGGGVVAGVEVSTDGGSTWHPATLTTPDQQTVSWSYTWNATGYPSTRIQTRAVDDSGNLETPSDTETVGITCPCSLWGTNVDPATAVSSDAQSLDDSGDPNSVEVGLKFQADTFGVISGIRFYKASANTGTHVGSLWTASGQLLAQATFTGETASGWQTVNFSQPVPVLANTTYVAGYFAPNGHYAATSSYFYPGPAPTPLGGASDDSPPLSAVANATSDNGLYLYTNSSAFPTSTYGASNYWVDVAFNPSTTAPGQVSNVTATAGSESATVSWSAPSSGGPPTSYTVTPYIGQTAQTPVQVPGSPLATSTTITGLTGNTPYTFVVTATNPNGTGAASAPSASVTPTQITAPTTAPTNVTAAAASSQALVTWTAPSNDGGSSLTGYTVTPYAGGVAQTPVQISNGGATSATLTGLANGTAYTFTVAAANAVGPGPTSPPTAAVTPNDTIFDFATPVLADAGDPNGVELGVKFTADVAGSILGVRFYKASDNTGTHAVHLWTAGGQLLAGAWASNETAQGWQQVMFSSPVAIDGGSTYVASYYAPNGHYSDTVGGLESAVNNAPLHAVGNGTSVDGVYAYGPNATFPTNAYQASNYWVDVIFAPTAAPGQVTGVSATASQGAAQVSWTAPSSGGAPTKYLVTPYVGTTAQTATTVAGDPPATSATIGNLTPGTSYTFTVQAVNASGTGPVSAPSQSVTPTGLAAPGAPTNVTAIPASSEAHVSWTPPANNGGAAISGYTITPYLAGVAQTPTQVLDGNASSAVVTGLTNNSAYTFSVSASNSAGAGAASAPSGSVVPDDTIFDFGTPATADAGDPSGVVLGTAFTPGTNGHVTGIRFYKSAANTGTHVGSLWTEQGQLLASVTFSGESASGWQTAMLASPVPVTAGTTYVVSYYDPNGHYSVTPKGFGTSMVNGPLTAVANGSTPNGVYSYGSPSSFPSSDYNATNYWVDVLFDPS